MVRDGQPAELEKVRRRDGGDGQKPVADRRRHRFLDIEPAFLIADHRVDKDDEIGALSFRRARRSATATTWSALREIPRHHRGGAIEHAEPVQRVHHGAELQRRKPQTGRPAHARMVRQHHRRQLDRPPAQGMQAGHRGAQPDIAIGHGGGDGDDRIVALLPLQCGTLLQMTLSSASGAPAAIR